LDPDLRIRRAALADVPAMINLERQASTSAHWSVQQYEAMFVTSRGPQPSERFAWVVEDESEHFEVLAFLVAHRMDAEWELENIVVAGSSRRRGVGTLLLGELTAHARATKGSEIFLEVRESNHSARALYRKAGFEETGIRKRYYSEPSEDAILYRLKL
jgi:[ribosomal protein S18]-alanine N-acetyltransferase